VTVTWDSEKIDQWLTGASLVTIPETIPGRISAPVPVNRKVRFHLIDLVTVFDAILTSRQTREKLQCLYENLITNNFRKTALLKKI